MEVVQVVQEEEKEQDCQQVDITISSLQRIDIHQEGLKNKGENDRGVE